MYFKYQKVFFQCEKRMN